MFSTFPKKLRAIMIMRINVRNYRTAQSLIHYSGGHFHLPSIAARFSAITIYKSLKARQGRLIVTVIPTWLARDLLYT